MAVYTICDDMNFKQKEMKKSLKRMMATMYLRKEAQQEMGYTNQTSTSCKKYAKRVQIDQWKTFAIFVAMINKSSSKERIV